MEISPDGTLYAECYIQPRDIGLIRVGQQAVLQVDAFNYNEWGLLQAQVIDIAHDVTLTEGAGHLFFKVFCTPERTYMTLKNGQKGLLMKGMTFHVRFMITKRTFFQWLFDKMDNWLNPNITS
jgi:HlyD family secretion protein